MWNPVLGACRVSGCRNYCRFKLRWNIMCASWTTSFRLTDLSSPKCLLTMFNATTLFNCLNSQFSSCQVLCSATFFYLWKLGLRTPWITQDLKFTTKKTNKNTQNLEWLKWFLDLTRWQVDTIQWQCRNTVQSLLYLSFLWAMSVLCESRLMELHSQGIIKLSWILNLVLPRLCLSLP